MPPPPTSAHIHARPLPSLCEPLPIPNTRASVPHSWRTTPWSCFSYSTSPMIRTCHTVIILGRDGSPHPGPLSCPAGGGAEIVPRGQYDSNPSLGTPTLGMTRLALPNGRKYDMSEALPVVGVGVSITGTIIPPCDVPSDGSPGTLLLIPHHTKDRRFSHKVFPGVYSPTLSSVVRSINGNYRVLTLFLENYALFSLPPTLLKIYICKHIH